MAVDKLVDSTQLDSDLTSVANAIRAKSGGSGQLAFPAGFVSEIGNISGGGGSATLVEKTINANGTYNASGDSADGYSKVVVSVPASAVDSGTKSINSNGTHDVTGYASASVSVPNSYSAGDEGKVVSNGALVSQSSDSVTTNGTYDTTLINSLTVNVSGGGNAVRSGTYTPASDTTGPSFDVGDSNVTHFLILTTTSLLNTQSKKMFECGYTEFGEKDEFSITSNNTGGGPVTRLYQDSWWSKSGSVITCDNTGTSGAGAAGYFVAGATYKWYAW